MFEQAIKKIQAAETIAILAHISEDADAAGSSFALAEVLRGMGKEAVCYFSDTLEARLRFMDGEYTVYTGQALPAYDLCISLDAGGIDRLGSRAAIFNQAGNTVSIDHHCANTNFAQVNCVVPDISSTGELLWSLFQEMGAALTKPAAAALYTAIAGDTGCFKYSNVTPDTLRIAAALLEVGIPHAEICRRLFDTNELAMLQFKGWVMQNIKSYFGGQLRLVAVDQADFDRFGVAEKDAGDIVDIPRSVQGTEIAVAIRQLPEKTKISFRSNGRYSVNEIAARFGGGGHMMAAGASVSPAEQDIVKRIVAACGEIIHD